MKNLDKSFRACFHEVLDRLIEKGNEAMAINWKEIRKVWDVGHDNLNNVATANGITVPEITLKAQQEGWPPRGSNLCVPGNAGPQINVNFDSEILNDAQVTLAHKTDLGRLRLLAAAVMENLAFTPDPGLILKTAERLAKIYAIIIPLERKVFGIDSDQDGAPDGIIIHNYTTRSRNNDKDNG